MPTERRFAGKVAFISGAASGIGRAAALAFAREGAAVAVADISERQNQETANLIEGLGEQALAVECDVSAAEDVKAALSKAMETFSRLDMAFNNAGIEVKEGNTAEAQLEDWDRIMNVNLRGVFLCVKYEIPLLLQTGGGAIVNMSSIAGLVGLKNSSAYTASKHGVIGLTKAAAIDYAQSNIRINAVCPGLIDTPLSRRVLTPDELEHYAKAQPMARVAKPEEVAAAVLWLCSDAASFVTGSALTVDGGFTAT
jgi:NAD(P)-dependent dehydrogenase (short-subunit alcohol dehydrogenase family)